MTPSKTYQDSLTNLLKTNFKEISPENYIELSEEIIEQTFLGCLVEIEDEEPEDDGTKNCYAVATILKHEEHKVNYLNYYFVKRKK